MFPQVSLCIVSVHVCAPVFVCIYFCLLREREKADNVGAQNRKGFKIRLGCKGGNTLKAISSSSSSLDPDSGFPPPASPVGGQEGGSGWENWNHLAAGSLAYVQRGQSLGLCSRLDGHRDAERGGHSGGGSLSVSLQGQWFLAQDVVAGKPDCSGMLCSRVL